MGAIYCADCKKWEPCDCVPQHQTDPQKTPRALLVVGGLLGAARFYFATPGEKRKMVTDAAVRLKKIKDLHTERTKLRQQQKTGK